MQLINQPNDEQLQQWVRQSQTGDSQAFGQLYDALYDKLYAYAYKRTFDRTASEDIVANGFYHMLTHMTAFVWQGSAQFYAWAFCIVMNELASYYRQDGKYVLSEEWLAIADTTRGDDSQHDTMVRDERYVALHRAIGELPSKLSPVLELYYFAGLSHADIALTLAINEGTARVRLHRAIELLQTKMEGDNYAYRG